MDSARLHARLLAIDGVSRARVAETVDSTNLRVAEFVAAGSGVGVVVVASRQAAGRGRRSRQWHDVAGGNVAVSLGVALPTGAVGLVPLAAALALRDVFTRAGATPSLKWPNDVRLVTHGRPRKAAGILVQGHPGATPPVAVIGVGVNVDWRDRHPAHDEAHDWTSLAEAVDGDVDREDLVVALVTALQGWHQQVQADPDRVLHDYRAVCATLGQRVGVELGVDTANGTDAGRLVGIATRVTDDGCLVVATDRGDVTVAAGDLVHLRPAP